MTDIAQFAKGANGGDSQAAVDLAPAVRTNTPMLVQCRDYLRAERNLIRCRHVR